MSIRPALVLSVLFVSICTAAQPPAPAGAGAATLPDMAEMPGVPTEPLHKAVMMGDESTVKKLIDEGANVNALDKAKMTPLVYAANYGRVAICKLLLDAKADPNAPGAVMSPLMIAVRSECVMGSMRTPMGASPTRYTDVVKMLLDAGAPADANTGMPGMSPLMTAVSAGSVSLVELLLEKGANPTKGLTGQTPLDVAQAKAVEANRLVELLRAKAGPTTAAAAPAAGGPAERRGPMGMPRVPNRNPYGAAPEPVADPMAGQPGAPDANEAVILAILADANGVMARVTALPDVNTAVKAVDLKARSEESAWRQRTADNRATLVRAVERQFNDEMDVLHGLAEGEKAINTTKAVEILKAKRQVRYTAIAEEMRALRQTAVAENQAMGTGRGRGGNMAGGAMMGGRGNRGMTGATGEGMMGEGARRGVARRPADPNRGAGDAEFDPQFQAWSSSNYDDKRELLAAVHELDLKELESLNVLAREEKAAKTQAAIEGLMVLRQARVTRIGVQMEKEDQRLQRLQDRTGGTTGTRGGRGGMTGTQQQGMRGGRY
jgi:hypothetical protein